MPAVLLVRERVLFADGALIDILIWKVPRAVLASKHDLKYSLFYGKAGERLICYGNERGKGDHRHVRGEEDLYDFMSVERLLADFRADVEAMRGERI